MDWDTPDPPPDRTSWRFFVALVGVVAFAVLVVGGVTGRGPVGSADDARVLDVATAEEELELPAAPGGEQGVEDGDPAAAGRATAGVELDGDGPGGARVATEAVPDARTTSGRLVVLSGETINGTLTVVDLDTGVRRSRSVRVSGPNPDQLAVHADGQVLVLETDALVRYSADLAERTVVPTDPPASRIWGDGDGDVWSLVGGGSTGLRHLPADGAGSTIAVPAWVTPLATFADGMLVSAAGTVSVMAADGGSTTVARGEVLGVGREHVAVLRCPEDVLECGVEVVAADGGRRSSPWQPDGRGAAIVPGFPAARVSPDGGRLARYDFTAASGVRIVDLENGELVPLPRRLRTTGFASLVWGPDSGRHLAVGGTRAVQIVDLDGGSVDTIEVPGEVYGMALLPPAGAGGS